jgi:hypothetical protein
MPGYSEACVQGHHESCSDRDCRCMCSAHPWNRKSAPPSIPAPGSSLACPACNRTPRPGDQFCRNDGEKLIFPQKCVCGATGDKADQYCGKCGLPFGRFIKDSPQLSDEEVIGLEAKARSRPSDVEVPPTEVH